MGAQGMNISLILQGSIKHLNLLSLEIEDLSDIRPHRLQSPFAQYDTCQQPTRKSSSESGYWFCSIGVIWFDISISFHTVIARTIFLAIEVI
jgi:hypothetical protein